MEVNKERKVEWEEGGGDDDNVGGRMEVEEDCGSEVNVEEIEVDPPAIPSRKTEQLYKTHEKQFLAFFPAEIWKAILGQLKDDPDAQTNCANASPYFWELLKKDRVLFLFPKVVEVIVPMANKRNFGMYVELADEENEYKEMEPYFWKKEDQKNCRVSILESRLVCSAWNKAVEHCYSSFKMVGTAELLADKNMDPRSPAKRMGTRWTYHLFRFDSFRVIQHFLKEFQCLHFFNPETGGGGGSPKNPFFGRGIIIKVPRGEGDRENCKTGMTQLLNLFGREVWYCYIECLVSPVMAKEVPSILESWRQIGGIRWLSWS